MKVELKKPGKPLACFAGCSRVLVRIRGDGYCLFRALAIQLYGGTKFHLETRRSIASWVRNHLQDSSESPDLPRGKLYLHADVPQSPGAARPGVQRYVLIEVFSKELLRYIGQQGSNFNNSKSVLRYSASIEEKKNTGGLFEALVAGCLERRPVFVWVESHDQRPSYVFFPNLSSNKSRPIGLLHDGASPVGHWDAVLMQTNETDAILAQTCAEGACIVETIQELDTLELSARST